VVSRNITLNILKGGIFFMDDNVFLFLRNLIAVLENNGIYIAPIAIYIEPIDGMDLYVQVTKEAEEKYGSAWRYIGRNIADTFPEIDNLYFIYNTSPPDLSIPVYGDTPYLGIEYNMKTLIDAYPVLGQNLLNQLREYLGSYRIQKVIKNANIDKEDILEKVKKHRVIVKPNVGVEYRGLEKPILVNINIFNESPEKLYENLIHELTHFIDDSLGILKRNRQYTQKKHEQFAPDLFDAGIPPLDAMTPIARLPNEKKTQLYKWINTLRSSKGDKEEFLEVVKNFEPWYERHLSFLTDLSPQDFLSYILSTNQQINIENYRSDQNEFFANINAINFLRSLGLTKGEIEKMTLSYNEVSLEDIPEEWLQYAKSAGWDWETTLKNFQKITIPRAFPFEELWEYATSSTIDESAEEAGQKRMEFAGNWYNFYRSGHNAD
jgi:hypothetical protein